MKQKFLAWLNGPEDKEWNRFWTWFLLEYFVPVGIVVGVVTLVNAFKNDPAPLLSVFRSGETIPFVSLILLGTWNEVNTKVSPRYGFRTPLAFFILACSVLGLTAYGVVKGGPSMAAESQGSTNVIFETYVLIINILLFLFFSALGIYGRILVAAKNISRDPEQA